MEYLLLVLLLLLNNNNLRAFKYNAAESFFLEHIYNDTGSDFKSVRVRPCTEDISSIKNSENLPTGVHLLCKETPTTFISPLFNNGYDKRFKRANSGYGPIRGQTQSQYLNFGKDEKPGTAEAESGYGSSRAVVSGSSGMGQAQSQSLSIDCEECVNQQVYTRPTAEIQLRPETILRPGDRIPSIPGAPGDYIPRGPQVHGVLPDLPGIRKYPPGTPGLPTGPPIPRIPEDTSRIPGVPVAPHTPGGIEMHPHIPSTPGIPPRFVTPSIPGTHYIPGKPPETTELLTIPGTPGIPGSPTYQPATPGFPGIPTYKPGTPAYYPGIPRSPTYQPGIHELPGIPTYQPGTPGLPETPVDHRGTPGTPGFPTYQPGTPRLPTYQPGTPSLPTYQPGTPSLPTYQPGTSGLPGIPAYSPGSPGLPTYQPGSPGLPTYQPGSPGLPTYQPGTSEFPGISTYQPGAPGIPTIPTSPYRPATPGLIPGAPGTPPTVGYYPGGIGVPNITTTEIRPYSLLIPRKPIGPDVSETLYGPGPPSPPTQGIYTPGSAISTPYQPGIPGVIYKPGAPGEFYQPRIPGRPTYMPGTPEAAPIDHYPTDIPRSPGMIYTPGVSTTPYVPSIPQLTGDYYKPGQGSFSGQFHGRYDTGAYSKTDASGIAVDRGKIEPSDGHFSGRFSGGYGSHAGQNGTFAGQFSGSYDHHKDIVSAPTQYVPPPGIPLGPSTPSGQYIPGMTIPEHYKPTVHAQYLPGRQPLHPIMPEQYTPQIIATSSIPSAQPQYLPGIVGHYVPAAPGQYPTTGPQGPPGQYLPGIPGQLPSAYLPTGTAQYQPGISAPGQYIPVSQPGIPGQYIPVSQPGGSQYIPGQLSVPGAQRPGFPVTTPGSSGMTHYTPGQYPPSGQGVDTTGQYLPGPTLPGTQYTPGVTAPAPYIPRTPGYHTPGISEQQTPGVPIQYPQITPSLPGGPGHYVPGVLIPGTAPGIPGQYIPDIKPSIVPEQSQTQYIPGIGDGRIPSAQIHYQPGEKPEELALIKDDGQSQAESSVQQISNETQASASAQGSFQGGTAQSQVSGIYSGSGSFSASAGTIDGKRGVQTSVSGGKEGAISSSQGSGGASQSQAQVQVASATGETSSSAQSGGINHGTNTQVQASEKGGMADAQSNGPGNTSSQAQIGFTPYDKSEHDTQNTPFKGGGTASAQGGVYTGQSQAQIQGKFAYGIRYTGAAQAGSGTNASLSRNQPRPSGVSSIFKPFTSSTTPNPITTMKADISSEYTKPTQENELETTTLPPLPPYKKTHGTKHEKADDEDYDYEEAEYDEAMEPNSAVNTRTLIKQEDSSQKQHIVLDPLEELDATVIQDHGHQLPTSTVLQPGQLVPGSPGLRIPQGFRGKVTSVAGERTEAHGSNSQAQSVTLTRGVGKITYKKPVYTVQSKSQLQNGGFGYGTSYTYQPIQHHVKSGDSYPKFVSVTKTENGYRSPHTGKKVPSVYYTQTSTCGYFTNTCVYSNGKKICLPKQKTNPDGSPMKC